MNEQFHTEDCGISLICRCCRGPVCCRRLSRADRMALRRELWPTELPRRTDAGTRARRWTIRRGLAARMFGQVARWTLPLVAAAPWVLRQRLNAQRRIP